MDKQRASMIIQQIATIVADSGSVSPRKLFEDLGNTASKADIQEAIQIGLHERRFILGEEFKVCLPQNTHHVAA